MGCHFTSSMHLLFHNNCGPYASKVAVKGVLMFQQPQKDAVMLTFEYFLTHISVIFHEYELGGATTGIQFSHSFFT